MDGLNSSWELIHGRHRVSLVGKYVIEREMIFAVRNPIAREFTEGFIDIF
jgi:stage III sporulation protein SpoIIIAA